MSPHTHYPLSVKLAAIIDNSQVSAKLSIINAVTVFGMEGSAARSYPLTTVCFDTCLEGLMYLRASTAWYCMVGRV